MSKTRHPNLGELATTWSRDAVHMAVAPVTAGETLAPGQHVTVDGEGKAYAPKVPGEGETIGVVSPFLRQAVEVGQRFWLLLYPENITGLRHEWGLRAVTRTDMVLKAARAMYHNACQPTNLTEDDAWHDADETCREIYIAYANQAYVSFGATFRELLSVARGSCLCRKELQRDSRDIKYRDTDSIVITTQWWCSTCGGYHGS